MNKSFWLVAFGILIAEVNVLTASEISVHPLNT